jgi:archaellum component FlaG (FlaF/FlaG flagellin family)
MTSNLIHRLRARAGGEEGFTMLIVIGVLFVGSLLAAAAFTGALGDIQLTTRSDLQSKAYYAAQAGIQRYQHELSSNPNYWVSCKTIGPLTVTGATEEQYTVKTLASESSKLAACESGKQTTTLETSGPAKGTFRVLATGVATSGSLKSERKIVATFSHPGFTKYVYESNYEVEDPSTFEPEPTECEHYYSYRSTHNNAGGESLTKVCPPIQFAPTDEVKGPLHTNDAADVCASGGNKPKFGRTSEDAIEMNGGHYAASGCSNEPNILGAYSETAPTLLPPETDVELLEAAGLKFEGRTELELHSGTPNTITGFKTNQTTGARETITSTPFPSNGVIYVTNSSKLGCSIAKYTPFGSDTVHDAGCGNVYVKGEYTESLTIGSEDDVIIDGNIQTSTNAAAEPTGGATVGLIAQNFVRLYHPVKRGYEAEHTTPTVQREGECVTELNGGINSTTEFTVTSATPWGLKTGFKVEGTVAGQIEAGTTISSISETSPKKIVLSKAAKKTEPTTKLKFIGSTGTSGGSEYEYTATNNKCHQKLSGYAEYIPSENLYLKTKCETESSYAGKVFGKEAFCKYENTSTRCTEKAKNLSAAEDLTENGRSIGELKEPVIDAAILSTKHSWIVDNYKCGASLGKLTVWGSIAQYWRGPVGTGGGTGYIKNYNYDQRLASQQPPNFLSPSTTTWHLSRQTAPPSGFTG